MQRHYDELLNEQRGPYTVIVDKTWEDLDPADCFDDGVDEATGLPIFDIKEMYEDINNGNLDWFMLRCRVFYEGVELAEDYIGGFLYKDAKEVLTDGTAEDMIYCAIEEAKKEAALMKKRFKDLVI
jgi:hypothetical protein